jgi:hypothetical protein
MPGHGCCGWQNERHESDVEELEGAGDDGGLGVDNGHGELVQWTAVLPMGKPLEPFW